MIGARTKRERLAARLSDRLEAIGEAIDVAVIDDPLLAPVLRRRVGTVARRLVQLIEREPKATTDTPKESS